MTTFDIEYYISAWKRKVEFEREKDGILLYKEIENFREILLEIAYRMD